MKYLSLIFSTFFGIGYIKVAPGTFGSLSASILYLILYNPRAGDESNAEFNLLVITCILFILGTVFSWIAARSLNDKDPQIIVIDEVLGMAVTYLFLPKTIPVIVTGFILFRLLDIIKPFPAFQAQNLPGGLGIMCDDLFAGVYANLILRVLINSSIFKSFSGIIILIDYLK
ncbi:MAG: phosphatidylglycerophosphatase A [Candidatus Coatesbacteria bacterium]|nr:phosphatidylglycerophosphatase A [Candidatus Coatesbacteria bacterium]